MKKALFIPCIGICILLQACGLAPASGSDLPLRSMPLAKGQSIFVDIDSGNIDISNSGEAAVEISGQVASPIDQWFHMATGEEGIHITSKTPSRPFWLRGTSPARLQLRVPTGASVRINSYDAGMGIHDFTGNLDITAVSGDIMLRNSHGIFAIKSNRGNISAEGTSGELHLAGNYGLLSMVDARGSVEASTIMGTVRFAGLISIGDNMAFETDHGPVEIQLSQNSDVTVKVGTTTGVITCTMPGLHYDGQACTGTLQAGQGRLTVRTVSGSATLGEMP